MTSNIRVAVIDDHPLFREGVTRSLTEQGGFEIVGEGSSTADALRIAAEAGPDILLMDISLPGGGLNVLPDLLARDPERKIVMLTVSESSDDVLRALQSGASGYVLKGVGSRSLAEILRGVAAGERYVSPSLSAQMLTSLFSPANEAGERDALAELTAREQDVLALVAAGFSNKRIALKLELTEKTIKHYMSRIMAKLAVSNRTEAAMLLRDARPNGVMEPFAGSPLRPAC